MPVFLMHMCIVVQAEPIYHLNKLYANCPDQTQAYVVEVLIKMPNFFFHLDATYTLGEHNFPQTLMSKVSPI